MLTDPLFAWVSVLISLVLLAGYEVRVYLVGKSSPERIARSANARVRLHWAAALSAQPGFEIVAVQALRNSLMSSTISASTAALAVMGTVSMTGSALAGKLALGAPVELLHTSLQAVLVLTLFACYVCSAMAMRHYGHASFIMSLPFASPERASFTPAAANHVHRAGLLYSWGLRLFLMAAPVAVGIVHPLAMPVMTVLLLIALRYFDQPADLDIE